MAITVDSRQARRPGRTPGAAATRVGQRARAFAAAQRHSRLIGVLRVLCPLAAATVLAGYGLMVAINWQLTAGKFKIGGVQITADDLTMKDPSYFDVTSDGRYEVRAKRAVVTFGQDKKQPIKLIDVSGELTKKSGEVTHLKAKHGLFDNPKGELELFDGIEIDGSSGMMARLSRAMIYSKENKIVSNDPVSATTPTGSVQAAAMIMNNRTRLVQFRGNVAVRLVPQQGQGIGAGLGSGGKDARQPVDVRSDELDVDDAAKTAHFRGDKVVAVQGETMLQAPYLMVKYEGKAAAALGAGAEAPAAKEAGAEAGREAGKEAGAAKESTKVTFLWVRNGVEITAGSDRRIVSDTADFDVAADTALFLGKVVATQDKNVLKGGRLWVDRKAGRSRLETPGGRIAATFQPQQSAAAQATRSAKRQAADEVQGAVFGAFKTDRDAPMDVDANTLDLIDTSNKAVFSGNVNARQGDLLLRTSELTAFYTGRGGIGFASAGNDAEPRSKGSDKASDKASDKGPDKNSEKSEIVRLEARGSVIMDSRDQSATGKWANFDVKANTAVLGGGVVVTKQGEDPLKPTVIKGDRLKVDLTTGIYQVESEVQAPPLVPPLTTKAPALSASSPTTTSPTPAERVEGCPPGKQCVLLYPNQVKDKAVDAIKKKAPLPGVTP
jgi:lipopolysaccharide export system protein LptA